MLQQFERVGRQPLRITLSNFSYRPFVFPTPDETKIIQELRAKNIFVAVSM
jgi:hypothetical protein